MPSVCSAARSATVERLREQRAHRGGACPAGSREISESGRNRLQAASIAASSARSTRSAAVQRVRFGDGEQGRRPQTR